MAKSNDEFVGVFGQQLRKVTRQLSAIKKELLAHGLKITVGGAGHRLPGPTPNMDRICRSKLGTTLTTKDFEVALNESLKWLRAATRVTEMKPKRGIPH